MFEKRYRYDPTYHTLVAGIAELREIYEPLLEVPFSKGDRLSEAAPMYERIDGICERILESDPPMYTDTLIRLRRVRLLCRDDSDPDIRPTCIALDLVFLIEDLESSAEDFRIRGPARRVWDALRYLVWPEPCDKDLGKTYRIGFGHRIRVAYMYWSVERDMRKEL